MFEVKRRPLGIRRVAVVRPSPGDAIVDLAMNPTSASTPLVAAPPQLLIVLAGVVGSGKSTFAHALVKQVPVRCSASEL